MYWIDIGALLILLVMVIHSALRGFVKESVVAAAWVAGYFGSVALQPLIAPFLKIWLKTGVLALLVSFFFAFILIYIGVRISGVFIVKKLGVKKIPASVNHSAGAVIGGVKWVFFLAILLSPLDLYPDLKAKLMENSLAAESVIKMSKTAASALGAGVGELPDELTNDIKRITDAAKKRVKKGAKSLDESLKMEESADIVEELTEDDRKQMDKLLKKLN
jgi:uncharacterized membrane protein required for colicin V production